MRKTRLYPYLFLFTVMILIISLPLSLSEKIRNGVIATLSPLWKSLSELKFQGSHSFETTLPNPHVKQVTGQEEILRLELENKLLYAEIIQLRDLVEHLPTHKTYPQAIPARIIYRSPNSWHSTLWINLGSEDNEKLLNPILGHNSPVLVGSSVIGVIDYVGKNQSRVRLITDSGLTPSVRVVRKQNEETLFLAKGELTGAGKPAWRSNGHVLHGIGFNYDFDDEKGPARDLRTGEPLAEKEKYPAVPLLAVGDQLVTTGMDGVFPPELNVAVITKLYPLKEGDYFYELEAEPTAGKLDDLSLVFILPPIGFDISDRPPPIGR